MKKHFLNIGLLFTIGLATVAFVSCKTDKADESFVIKAENVMNSSDETKTVVVGWFDENEIGQFMSSLPFAQAPFQNNGFELTLPGNISTEYLSLISYMLNEFDEFYVSDVNAQWFGLIYVNTIQALDVNGSRINIISLMDTFEDDDKWQEWRVGWIYADRDVVVRKEARFLGYETWIDTRDLNLKRGWNTVYMMSEVITNQQKVTTVLTTTKPVGVNFQWVAEDKGEVWMRIFDMWQNFPYSDE